ncbi:RNA polymerase sigma factor [Longimicrobium terrae]|uniref:RNA polymerase sigma-70 factor (ECF subfamily) n=1 Tax=Longimicrobium terrae TaxID=1639882 RepID=A0A841GXY8_9BACT|nr:sigma-70 family RNA polymerase sigma factor [Longimicrobium terrae]MBB4636225.1 RNA polymerase sigma-70 factor (ECF subfamily) [Longimicrobium terrae]MBB6070620.1 RNA polymerase sigma-70 factor (ECF subfamily) [Longimicrobium terrae]NNC29605.1 sigma-70 family RNA polymerase sigma factor [Longimicrobium terrae]
MDDTDNHLIHQARQGDGGAVRALYERHAQRVYAVVKRLAGHDDALAEDWAQEAWVRAIRALPTFRGDARFTTWLHRIAVNSALHGRRTRMRKAGRETVMMDDTFSVRAVADTSVLKIRLERAMEQLPEGMRKVLVLHDVEGYTHEEIGEMLGVTAGTCKSQLFKARARMRRLLAPRPAADEPAEEEMAACAT